VTDGSSLYRRHRPRTFGDVVGQEHVVRTLRHAIERDKVHHAYLFVGSRGTGKTSMAKILAACLNCESGPTVEPCGTCDSCVAIADARSLDVIETDAASNNSVDDIRDLREKVAFAPVSGRHKVYILDEAHMLSTAAWNAFLKTLEEPPPDTVFVLATTEAHKVLPTVVDRCHRFDFSRPSVEQIAEVLGRTAQAEGIDLPQGALGLIARAATGSFRDALGRLEEIVTYSGPQVSLDDVVTSLGLVDADLLFGAVDAIAEHDARAALIAVARLGDTGRDLGQFFRDLEAHARELLVVQTLEEVPAELRLTPEHDERLLAQAARLQRGDVVRLLDMLAAGLEAQKAGADPRVQLELALVKAATPEVDASTRALLTRLERLESGLPGARGAPATHAGPASAPPAEPAEPAGSAPAAAPAVERPVPAPRAAAAVAVAAESTPAAEPVPDSPPAAAPGAPDLDLESMTALWPAVIETIRAENKLLGALLADARPVALEGERLTIGFAATAEFLKRKAEDMENRATLGEAVRTVTGRRLKLAFELREDAGGEEGVPTLSGDEWIERFMREFDAEEIPADPDEPEDA